jgi:pimeloyl-ACP methyl ester carboxylesterase
MEELGLLKLILRKVGKGLMYIMGIFLACFLLIFIYFSIRSPGKVSPYLDKNGNLLENSISEKIFVEINGVEQGMFIKGENRNNPVLLFLHGGPGIPEYFLTEKYKTGLEKYFTVCYWEQTGGGLSYHSDISGDKITVQRLVLDTVAVTNYLRERFSQDKIFLMGHSWGAFLGIQVAAVNPDLYYAYIGVSQISNTAKSETMAYDYMIEQFTTNGNTSKVNKFKKYNIHNNSSVIYEYMTSAMRDNSMHELGIGTMRDMNSVVTGVFFPIMNFKAYTLSEKINIWRAKSFLSRSTELHQELIDTDLSKTVTELEIPVYILAGRYDYTVNYDLQKNYFDKINAPKKGFYTFENSAHSPMFEEPERFIEIMVNDVLNGNVNLTDK